MLRPFSRWLTRCLMVWRSICYRYEADLGEICRCHTELTEDYGPIIRGSAHVLVKSVCLPSVENRPSGRTRSYQALSDSPTPVSGVGCANDLIRTVLLSLELISYRAQCHGRAQDSNYICMWRTVKIFIRTLSPILFTYKLYHE